MHQDGWWWRNEALTNKAIRRQIMKEMLNRWLPWRAERPAAAPAGIPVQPG
jgi:glutamate-1-semialdehyde 2,1-aminomutase